MQVSAHTWDVSQSARPATTADGSAHATDLTTISLAVSARAQHHSTWRSQCTTFPTTRALWSSVKWVYTIKPKVLVLEKGIDGENENPFLYQVDRAMRSERFGDAMEDCTNKTRMHSISVLEFYAWCLVRTVTGEERTNHSSNQAVSDLGFQRWRDKSQPPFTPAARRWCNSLPLITK